jgi:hypothetical protein
VDLAAAAGTAPVVAFIAGDFACPTRQRHPRYFLILVRFFTHAADFVIWACPFFGILFEKTPRKMSQANPALASVNASSCSF